MYRPTDRFENWFITSLQTGINDTTSSFRLNDNLNVKQARLVIDPYDPSLREVVKVTAVDGNLVYVERGDDNTTPQYHLEGAIVALNVVAADMNDLYADWAEVEADMQQALLDAADATNAANIAANSATSAAGLANTAASSANDAASDANLAAGAATSAASSANTAAGLANSATNAANIAAGNAQDAADAASLVIDDIAAAAFLAAHPVGSTYWNETDSRNPGDVWGGTWVALEGVVLGGRSTVSGSPFNVAAGTIIGEDEHTLTTAEMPSHNHSVDPPSTTTSSAGSHSHGIPNQYVRTSASGSNRLGGSGQQLRWDSGSPNSTNSAGGHTHTLNIAAFNSASTGGGGAHNNIQRTLVGYLWKRTA